MYGFILLVILAAIAIYNVATYPIVSLVAIVFAFVFIACSKKENEDL